MKHSSGPIKVEKEETRIEMLIPLGKNSNRPILKGCGAEKSHEKDLISKFKMEDFKNLIPDNVDKEEAGQWRDSII